MDNTEMYNPETVDAAESYDSAAGTSSGMTYDELVGTEIQVTEYQAVVLQRLDSINLGITFCTGLLFFLLIFSAIVTQRKVQR